MADLLPSISYNKRQQQQREAVRLAHEIMLCDKRAFYLHGAEAAAFNVANDSFLCVIIAMLVRTG